MPGFDTARQRVAEIDTATVNAPGVKDDATAAAITGFGVIAGDVILGAAKGGLARDLREQAEVVNVLNSAEEIRDPISGEITDLRLTGVDTRGIDLFTEQAQRLRRTREQGLISESDIALEAEVLLRQAINATPGFADQLRAVASRELRFDPSGAATQKLLGIGRGQSSGKQTLHEEMVEKALETSRTLGLPFADTMRLLTADILAPVHARNLDRDTALGNNSNADMTSEYTSALTQALSKNALLFKPELDTFGAFQSIELMSRQANELHRSASNRLAEAIRTRPGENTQSAFNNAQASLDTALKTHLAMIGDSDLAKFYERKTATFANAIFLAGMEIDPAMQVVIKLHGEEAGAALADFLSLAMGMGPAAREAYLQLRPSMKNAWDTYQAVDAQKLYIFGGSMLGHQAGRPEDVVTDEDLDAVPPPSQTDLSPEEQAAAAAIMLDAGIQAGNANAANAAVQDAISRQGLVKQPLSQIANDPQAWNLFNKASKAIIAQAFGSDLRVTGIEIARSNVSEGLVIQWNPNAVNAFGVGSRRGRFETGVLRDGNFITQLARNPSQIGGTFPRALEANDTVRYLNDTLTNVMRNPQALIAGGVTSLDEWGAQVADQINSGGFAEQIEGILGQPDLTKFDVGDIVRDAEDNLFRITEEGFEQVGTSGIIDQTSRRDPDISRNAVPAHKEHAIQQADLVGLDPNILLALIQQESDWVHFAADGSVKLGPSNKSGEKAVGLGQLLPSTAADLGVDPEDPLENIEGSAEYLVQQLDRFEDLELALAAYNFGPNGLARLLKTMSKEEFFQRHTGVNQYVENIMTNAGVQRA